MKSRYIITIIAFVLLMLSPACSRNEPADPGNLFGPSSSHYILEGSASPSILWINGVSNPTTIRVRATNYLQEPLIGKMIFFQQTGSSNGYYVLADYGYFENNRRTMYMRTDANGVAQVTFYGPKSVSGYSQTGMYINAIMQDIDQTYSDGPQEWIKIEFVNGDRD